MTARWFAVVLAIAVAACAGEAPPELPHDEWDDKLAERVLDYSAALRVAALRLTGDLPTLVEIEAIAGAPDDDARRAVYEDLVRDYLARPELAVQMFRFWQDTLELGGTPAFDQAAAFAAEITVERRSYMELFTAGGGTCPGFDPATGAFAPDDCRNDAPIHVGLLTHPGMNEQFFSNLAFRRVRWIQETFVCTRFPAELSPLPADVGGVMPYTGVFPFESIAGTATGGRVDFRDTSSVICANCHSTMNHIAPLFTQFDRSGRWNSQIVVPLPDGTAVSRTDYLPIGEPLAWRHGVPISDLPSLGRAIAADPDVAACAIARVWNWALGKPDIVDTLTAVPAPTIQHQVDAFTAGDYRLLDAIYDVYTSDDFVRF